MKKSKFLTIFAIIFMSVLSFAFVGCAGKDAGDEPVNVYNISVDKIEGEDYHTYYVGSDSVLVQLKLQKPRQVSNQQKQK